MRRKIRVNDRLFHKNFWAVAVMFVCIGIAIAPWGASGVARAVLGEEPVEVSARVCGRNGFGARSVFLTKQQYQTLTQYFVDLQARLHSVISREEAIVLFQEAIVQIDSYGLLPRDMSVTQAQQVIDDSFQTVKRSPFIGIDGQNTRNKRYHANSNPTLRNVFCFLSAVATKLPDYEPSPVILPFGLLLLLGMLPAFFASLLGNQEAANTLAEQGLYIWRSNPIRASNYVVILGYDVKFRSVGLMGIVNENLSGGVIFRGYSGLLLYPFMNTTYFLGYAIDVISSQ